MARTLDVYLHHDLVGHLTQDDSGHITFKYVDAWAELPRPAPFRNRSPSGKVDLHKKNAVDSLAEFYPNKASANSSLGI